MNNHNITNPCGDQHKLYVDLSMTAVLQLDNYLADQLNEGSHLNKTWLVRTVKYTPECPYTAVFTFQNLELATWVKMVIM